MHFNGGNEHEARPGEDYVAASGVVDFAPGQTTTSVQITINGDVLDEYDELFLISFHDPTNVTISGTWGAGFASITDDDALPIVVPDWATPDTVEGDSGLASRAASRPPQRALRTHDHHALLDAVPGWRGRRRTRRLRDDVRASMCRSGPATQTCRSSSPCSETPFPRRTSSSGASSRIRRTLGSAACTGSARSASSTTTEIVESSCIGVDV